MAFNTRGEIRGKGVSCAPNVKALREQHAESRTRADSMPLHATRALRSVVHIVTPPHQTSAKRRAAGLNQTIKSLTLTLNQTSTTTG